MRTRGPRLLPALAAACACIALGCGGEPEGDRGGDVSAGAARTPPPAHGKESPKAAARPDLAGMESEIVARVNRYRRSEGLPALSNDARIAEIARAHSREMASGKTGFGHAGFRDRTREVDQRIPYRSVAENVARHRRRATNEIPAVAVQGWVGSWGHRHNIEGKYSLTGVGAARGPDGSIYLTQIFVAPR